MMEGEGVCKPLPEDLVEKIMAMMPFPSLFKARVLSKSWLSKLLSFSSLDVGTSKIPAVSFQQQVAMWSGAWETYCPVLVGKDNFIVFDRTSHRWRRMPSLSYLPENLISARANLQIEGSLLYGFARPETRSRKKELYVTNILTRSWKQLPPRPNASSSVVLSYKLVSDKLGTYKLIMFCREGFHGQLGRYSAQIYDSNLDAWSIKRLTISSDFFKSSAAYLDGILYLLGDTHPRDLLAFNVKEEILTEFTLSFANEKRVDSVNLVVCNNNLLMIATLPFSKRNLLVLKVDLHAQRLVELARGPPESLDIGEINLEPVGDGKYIFFGVENCNSQFLGGDTRNRVLGYNMRDDEWSCLPMPPFAGVGQRATADRRYKWSASAFRLGLDPFVAA